MTRHRGFSTRTAFLLAAVLAVACAMARAQTDYPVKPIRLVVPFPPGGSVDLNARLLAIKFSEVLGQQIVVDNRAGASGQIGSEMVGRSAPDGYTLLLQSNPFVTSTILYAKPLYDPVNDFVPISLLSTVATAGRCPSLGAGPIGAGADRIRARAPGQLNYASSGIGSNSHMTGELLICSPGRTSWRSSSKAAGLRSPRR